MEVFYRQVFLKDLQKLRHQSIYNRLFEIAFTTLPEAKTLNDVTPVKAISSSFVGHRSSFVTL